MNELVSYLFMFSVGVLVLVMSMQILGESSRSSDELGAAAQLKSVAELVASNAQEAARIAALSPDAAFHDTITMPTAIDGRGYDVSLVCDPDPCGSEPPCDHEGRVVAELDEVDLMAEVPLTNAPTLQVLVGGVPTCLQLAGTVHSSRGLLEVRFEIDPPDYRILIQGTNR